MASSGHSAIYNFWAFVTSPSQTATFVRSVSTAALASAITFYALARVRPKVDPPSDSPPPTTSPGAPLQDRRKAALTHSDGRESSTESDAEGEYKRVRFDVVDRSGGFNKPIPVAVFWDVDNCSPPSGSSGRHLVHSIRKHLSSIEVGTGPEKEALGPSGPILSFKAYLELSSSEGVSSNQVTLRSELQGSGVSLIDTPKSGRKDVADKMIIADLMAFALDVPPPARIVLISGDRDFAYPLSLIRGRGYQIVLITPPIGAVPILEASANHVAKWRQDVLGVERDGFGRPYATTTPVKPLPRSSSPSRFTKPTPSKPSGSGTPTTPVVATPVRPTTPSSQLAPTQQQPAPQSQNQTTTLTGPGAGPVPGVFAPLVQALEEFKKEGQPRPLRSRVALRLTTIDKDVYEKAGASSFRDYAAVAIAAGIVTLGSNNNAGTEWISLRSLDPATFAASATPKKATASAPLNSWDTTVQSTAEPIDDVSEDQTDEADYAPSPAFEPLLHAILEAEIVSQRSPPVASIVGEQLVNLMRASKFGDLDGFALAGVKTFGAYINAAFKARVAKLVPTEKQGVAALEVMPVYQPYMAKLRRKRMTLPHSTASKPQFTSPGPSTFQPAKSTPIRPTSPIKRPASPTSKKGGFFPNLFRSKSDKGPDQLNGKKSAWDVPGLILPHQPSGTKIAAIYFPLANALLYQRERGQNYMTDDSLHTLLVKHKGIGDRIKASKDFASYLQGAEKAEVCTLEPGFKSGVKHVRLTPRLWDPKEQRSPGSGGAQRETLPPAGADPWDDDYGPDESTSASRSAAVTSAAALSNVSASVVNTASQSGPERGTSKPVSSLGQHDSPVHHDSTPTSSTSRAAATSNGTLEPSLQDRLRFKPLMDIMLALRNESPPVLTPRRSHVNTRLAKRWGIPVSNNPDDDDQQQQQVLGDEARSSSSPLRPGLVTILDDEGKEVTMDLNPFFRQRGAVALGDYSRQAQQYGFIICEREIRTDGLLGKRRLRLSEKYALKDDEANKTKILNK